jgi:hypothetical protein
MLIQKQGSLPLTGVELLRESVNRIQWALTDILPGEFDFLDVAMKNGSGNPVARKE